MSPVSYLLQQYFVRPLEEKDLPYTTRWYGKYAGLPRSEWSLILQQYQEQFRDPDDPWRTNAHVMVAGKRPVFLLELTAGQAYLLTSPSIATNPRRLMLAWQAALVYLFLQAKLPEVRINVHAGNKAEVVALERLGCLKETVHKEKSGLHYMYLCSCEDFKPGM